jgi:hypothetical protein
MKRRSALWASSASDLLTQLVPYPPLFAGCDKESAELLASPRQYTLASLRILPVPLRKIGERSKE